MAGKKVSPTPDGLEFDPTEARTHLHRVDPQLGRVISGVGALEIETRPTLSTFHTLLRAITYQQLSTHAARTIYGRVLGLFDDRERGEPDELLLVPEGRLREAGLSRQKTAAALDLAAKTVEGVVPPVDQLRRMDDEEIIDRLTQVRGVGRWTVEMLLIFHLGRPDVLPSTDLGIRKGFQLTYGLEDLPLAAEIANFGEIWRPFRTAASWYLWRRLDVFEVDSPY